MKPVIFLAFANDKVDNTRYLRNLPLELDGIRKALQKAVQAGLCEVVERANVTVENILDIFQDSYYRDRIAIFHYGGHADGYQLLLEQIDGSHAIAKGEGLVSLLAKQKGLKLIFFNGCSTQQQTLELVQAGVPAVIGTSNAINDDIATNLAIRFYKSLANGSGIERAWSEAIDQVKIQQGTANLRGLYRKTQTEVVADRFPWEIYYREGSEIVKEWNLPEAVDNPLFGLPELPQNQNLPEKPFRFLERYQRQHAELFAGRSYYIRELYNRITDKNSAPIILLYGQSGVGKSSLLDAGLLPRLEQVCQVKYLRRKQEIGLLGTLKEAFLMTKNQQLTISNNQLTTSNQQLTTNIKHLESLYTHSEGEIKEETQALIEALKKQLAIDNNQLTINNQQEAPNYSTIQLSNYPNLKQTWQAIEKAQNQPLTILLDQVEEYFTRPMPPTLLVVEDPNNGFGLDEFQIFLSEIKEIFSNPNDRPQGKLILSYRKEYHPELEEFFKQFEIPRERVFLQHLQKKDIVEVVTHLTKSERLKRKYQLSVESDLPTIIADDLLTDKESPIAPVLQILLTKMWNLAEKEGNHFFSVQKYQQLQKEGILMDDFFKQQMLELEQLYPEAVQSGFALEVLNAHTTKLGTADAKNLEELRAIYQHRADILNDLLLKFKELYLLVEISPTPAHSPSERGNNFQGTGLAHDTLAPIVQHEYRTSDKIGQRASIILENKRIAFEQNPETVIDEDDLRIVEEGANGMRLWAGKEEELIEKSRKKREQNQKQRKLIRQLGMAAIATILLVAVLAAWQWQNALKNADKINMQRLGFEAKNLSLNENTRGLAVNLAKIAYQHEEKKSLYALENLASAVQTFTNQKIFSKLPADKDGEDNYLLSPNQKYILRIINTLQAGEFLDSNTNVLRSFSKVHYEKDSALRYVFVNEVINKQNLSSPVGILHTDENTIVYLPNTTCQDKNLAFSPVLSQDQKAILTAFYNEAGTKIQGLRLWDLQGKILAELPYSKQDKFYIPRANRYLIGVSNADSNRAISIWNEKGILIKKLENYLFNNLSPDGLYFYAQNISQDSAFLFNQEGRFVKNFFINKNAGFARFTQDSKQFRVFNSSEENGKVQTQIISYHFENQEEKTLIVEGRTAILYHDTYFATQAKLSHDYKEIIDFKVYDYAGKVQQTIPASFIYPTKKTYSPIRGATEKTLTFSLYNWQTHKVKVLHQDNNASEQNLSQADIYNSPDEQYFYILYPNKTLIYNAEGLLLGEFPYGQNNQIQLTFSKNSRYLCVSYRPISPYVQQIGKASLLLYAFEKNSLVLIETFEIENFKEANFWQAEDQILVHTENNALIWKFNELSQQSLENLNIPSLSAPEKFQYNINTFADYEHEENYFHKDFATPTALFIILQLIFLAFRQIQGYWKAKNYLGIASQSLLFLAFISPFLILILKGTACDNILPNLAYLNFNTLHFQIFAGVGFAYFYFKNQFKEKVKRIGLAVILSITYFFLTFLLLTFLQWLGVIDLSQQSVYFLVVVLLLVLNLLPILGIYATHQFVKYWQSKQKLKALLWGILPLFFMIGIFTFAIAQLIISFYSMSPCEFVL